MKQFIIISLWAACAFLFPYNVSAQRSLTLQECLDEAFKRNLSLKVGQAEVTKNEILQKTAVDLPATSLSLSQDLTSGGSSENSWSVTQELSLPSVYSAKRRFLRSKTALSAGELAVLRHELVRDVTAAYYTLLYNREVMRIYEVQDTLYKTFVSLAEARYKMGDSGQLEKMNAERLYNENKLIWQQAEKNYAEAQLNLQKYIGTDEMVTPSDTTQTVLLTSGDDLNFKKTPWAEVYARQQKVSEDNVTVEKRGFLPDFTIGVRSQLVLSGLNPYNVDRSRFDKGNFMGFEIGISFPLFYGAQRARVKAARQEVLLNRLKGQQAEFLWSRQYARQISEYTRAVKTLEYYRTKGKPEADRMLQISKVSYEKGEIGYVEYIQNLKTASDIQLEYAGALNAYNQSVIILNYLQGNKQ